MNQTSRVFPWLPTGHSIGDSFTIGHLVDAVEMDGNQIIQLVESQNRDSHCLLIDKELCPSSARSAIKEFQSANFKDISWGNSTYYASVFNAGHTPYRLKDLQSRASLIQYLEAKDLANALSNIDRYSWSQSVYLPSVGKFIPLGEAESRQDRLLLVSKMLTANTAKERLSPRQIHAFNKWITPEEVSNILHILGLADLAPRPKKQISSPDEFTLPGQPKLESFFRKEIVEYFHNITDYQNMGTKSPGGILLYGKPGSGKTYAVRHLSNFLGWPMIEISIGRIGSPFIHQTSKELRRQFDKASEQAPCIIFMDEIDALGGERDRAQHEHKGEEIAELLKLVEEASNNGVIVVAATNRPDSLDPALKRTGRFDYQIEVKYPDTDAMVELLGNCLATRPHRAGINLRSVAETLSGKAASDAELIVNEAGKIAVREKKKEIDEECLSRALEARYGIKNVFVSSRPATSSKPANEAESVFEAAWRSIVLIKGETGNGSGVVIKPNIVATNCHVFDSGGLFVYKSSYGDVGVGEPLSATMWKRDDDKDFCLLEVPGLWAIPANLRKSDDLRIGENVYAIGAPQGLELSLSSGLISQLRDIGNGKIIQTDTAISPGSSGGGLFDKNGDLIGIITAKNIAEHSEGIGFAIPADLALEHLTS